MRGGRYRPMGLGNIIVNHKLGAFKSTSITDAGTMERIVRAHFPTDPGRPDIDHGVVGNLPLFSAEELNKAISSLRNRRAPGPDGIPNEVLGIVFRQNSRLLLSMYNRCLTAGVFSDRWKVARLLLISKGKGELDSPSFYRPLCVIDTSGKLLENLLKLRLTAAIRAAVPLSPRQYGFRVGMSIVNAIVEVAEAVRRAEEHITPRVESFYW